MPFDDVLPPLLRCWSCRGQDLRQASAGRLACSGCGARFVLEGGVVRGDGLAVFSPSRCDWLAYDTGIRDRRLVDMCDGLDGPILEHCKGSVLEVGCGTGRFLIRAAGRGWPLVGVDRSLDMLLRASERGLPNLVHAEAERLPFRDGAFDTVASVLSWWFVRDEAYREVGRVLRAGGRFVYHLEGAFWAGGRLVRSRVVSRGKRLLSRGPGARAGVHTRCLWSMLGERRLLAGGGMRVVATIPVGLPRGAPAILARQTIVIAERV